MLIQMQHKMIYFHLLLHHKQQLMKLAFGLLFLLILKYFIIIFSSDETYTENVLEKQADLIRYLRERNDHLARLAHQLKQQLNLRQTSPNSV
jgi:hypothetical protein